jgi:hypothetical protein
MRIALIAPSYGPEIGGWKPTCDAWPWAAPGPAMR